MDLKDRVMDILEGRAKMGAAKPKKPRSKKIVRKRGPVQEGLTQAYYRQRSETKGGRQMSKSRGGVRAAGVRAAGVQRAGVRAGVRAGKPKQSRWMRHVKKVQRETGLPYKEAMIEASKTYEKKQTKTKKTKSKPSAKAQVKARNNPWIKYVKEFARLNNISYSDALLAAGPYYRGEAQ